MLFLKHKYDIDIIVYEPGMLIVSVGAWDDYEELFLELIEELTVRRKICTIDREHHQLTIYYDEEKIKNEEMIQQLLEMIQQFDL